MKKSSAHLLYLLLTTLPGMTLLACADDLCKSHSPSFELRISLTSESAARQLDQLEANIFAAGQEKSLTMEAKTLTATGQLALAIEVGDKGREGFLAEVRIRGLTAAGAPLLDQRSSFSGTGDACNFFEMTIGAPQGDGGPTRDEGTPHDGNTPPEDGPQVSDRGPDQLCAPNSEQCEGKTRRRCNAAGTAYDLLEDCGALADARTCVTCAGGITACKRAAENVAAISSGIWSFDIHAYPGDCGGAPRGWATLEGLDLYQHIEPTGDPAATTVLRGSIEGMGPGVTQKLWEGPTTPSPLLISYTQPATGSCSSFGAGWPAPPGDGSISVNTGGSGAGTTWSVYASGYLYCPSDTTWHAFSYIASGDFSASALP